MKVDVVGRSRRYKSLRIRIPALPAQQAKNLTKMKGKIDESKSKRLDTNKDEDDDENGSNSNNVPSADGLRTQHTQVSAPEADALLLECQDQAPATACKGLGWRGEEANGEGVAGLAHSKSLQRQSEGLLHQRDLDKSGGGDDDRHVKMDTCGELWKESDLSLINEISWTTGKKKR